jgi:hypothetical protein
VHPQCDLGRARRDRRGDPGRGVVLRHPGRVARGVVEDAGLGGDLDRRQRLGALPQVDDGHRELDPVDEALHHDRVAVGEAADHRRGQVLHPADLLHTEGRAARGRLDHQRQPEPGHDEVQHRAGAQLAERAVRERDPVRRRDTGRPHDRLGRRLVPGQPAGRGRRADVGHAGQVQHRAQGAVLAGGAVQGDEHRVHRCCRQPGQQLGVRVVQLGLDPGAGERLDHLAAGVDADLPLEGQPAGEHERAQRVRAGCLHRCGGRLAHG